MVFVGLVNISLYGMINDFSNRSKLKRAVSFDTEDFSKRGFTGTKTVLRIFFIFQSCSNGFEKAPKTFLKKSLGPNNYFASGP